MKKLDKRGRGRPPKGDDTMLQPVTIRLPKEMDEEIERRRMRRLDRPDKSTLIRELLAKALKGGE